MESLERQSGVVKDEKRDQLERIRQAKHAAIMAHLNQHFPKCAICTTGLICPGFQPNNENPTLCKHCMHDNRKHQDRHKERDRNVTLNYLMDCVDKLGITVDFSAITQSTRVLVHPYANPNTCFNAAMSLCTEGILGP